MTVPETRLYSLYGLRIQSEIPLPAPLASGDQPADLRLAWGAPRTIPAAVPDGPLLAKLEIGEGRGYALAADEDGYTLRFYGTAESQIAPDLAHIRLHLDPATDPDLAGLLVIGNVLASVLTLSGEAVLHASAVEVNGSALAFLGNSGMGKSSLAALFCAHGARFITDDLLRLQADGDGWRCFPGTGQLRLRRNAAVLAKHFPADLLGATADDRIAVEMSDHPVLPPLQSLVIPLISREHPALKVERVPASKALIYLMGYARLAETAQKAPRQRRLDFLGRVAASVPLYEAAIPWGLPYDPQLAPSLAASVGAQF